MIQLIASDMDGTLLDDQMSISPKNAEMIKTAQAEGIKFLVATGRSFAEAEPTVSKAGIKCNYITSNGAQIFDADGNNIFSLEIEHQRTFQAMAILRKYDIYFELLTNQGGYSESEATRASHFGKWLMSTSPNLKLDEAKKIIDSHLDLLPINYIKRFDKILTNDNQKVIKIFAMGDINQDKLSYAREELEKIDGLVITSSGANNIEVNHIQAQKGITLKKVADKLEIPMKNVAAFGDNYNDVSMLKSAGIGVAMGNAEAGVKAIANYHTISNVESGVANAIENILNQNWTA
ncbi:MAG: Cof-type HAD-IIB family hydrolase [Streptococcaceae bacterium]|nr:Cof-type HAD-IIB family hydrolase [Streptococcaceae bacterium]MCH4177461.1 Cof-type HAD-IIB family hydrolase [Streptococcaceae bacterium]